MARRARSPPGSSSTTIGGAGMISNSNSSRTGTILQNHGNRIFWFLFAAFAVLSLHTIRYELSEHAIHELVDVGTEQLLAFDPLLAARKDYSIARVHKDKIKTSTKKKKGKNGDGTEAEDDEDEESIESDASSGANDDDEVDDDNTDDDVLLNNFEAGRDDKDSAEDDENDGEEDGNNAPNKVRRQDEQREPSNQQQSSSLLYSKEVEKIVSKHPKECSGKEPMLETLFQAKITLTPELCKQLPSWEQDVVPLYGNRPVILGLDRCQEYRNIIEQANQNLKQQKKQQQEQQHRKLQRQQGNHHEPPAHREAGPSADAMKFLRLSTLKRQQIIRQEQKSGKFVRPMPKLAGLWNTGSTALSTSFLKNFQYYIPSSPIYRATVPWGKHTPLWLKYINRWPHGNKDDPDLVLPVVVVRDPFRWMNTMCKSPYDARWKRGLYTTVAEGKRGRCPNFFPTPEEQQDPYYNDLVDNQYDVNTTNLQAGYNYVTHYKSLADLWSSWNGDYLHADFPRLIIRMEDTVFYPEQVMRTIAECSGMPIREPFSYTTDAGKGESDTTLVSAMVKYGSDKGRISTNLTMAEKQYLQKALDPMLMELLHYRPIQDVDIQ